MQQINAFRSKNELVYDALRAAIIQGDLKPGAHLVIDDLAETLGVSPIPVREALRQLEGDGFVTIQPYIGAMVTEIQATMVCEVFDLLGALESISGRAACRQMSEGDFEAMAALVRQMDAAVGDPNQWSRLNIQFHLLICDHARTPLIKSTMMKAFDHWDRLRNYYIDGVFLHRIETAQQDHWEMLETLRRRDFHGFVTLAERHNQAARAAYVNYLEAKGYIGTSADKDGLSCP